MTCLKLSIPAEAFSVCLLLLLDMLFMLDIVFYALLIDIHISISQGCHSFFTFTAFVGKLQTLVTQSNNKKKVSYLDHRLYRWIHQTVEIGRLLIQQRALYYQLCLMHAFVTF